jgi:putative N6-adenine-specific DNA methylase
MTLQPASPFELFVTCIPSLEPILEQELINLGFPVLRQGFGGIYVEAQNFTDIYKLNLMLRSASRILLPFANFECRNKEDLYNNALAIDWLYFFDKLPTFAIDFNVQSKAFTNTLFAAQVLKDAICDKIRQKTGARPSVDTVNPQIRINLFMQHNQATISFDTSGHPLNERGYRKDAGVAPLRESLAAALLLLAGYKKEYVLVDPCAGSGTFLIEAALIATNRPATCLRHVFGFMSHPLYVKEKWQEVRKESMKNSSTIERGHLIGIERNPKTFDALQKAIFTSGFEHKITLINDDFRKVDLPFKPNFVIANPPYGKRLQDNESFEPLYEDLGDFMKQKTQKPARGFILSGNNELSKKIGLKATRRHPINNGGIDCRFLEYDLY